MKKYLIIFASVFAACVACNKEKVEPIANDGFSITATAPDTKATVDGLQVKWTTGDQIALFIQDGSKEDFTLVGEGPVVSGTFNSSYTPTAARMPVGLAAYPATDAVLAGKKISMTIPSSFAYGTSPVPMVGVAASPTNPTYNFSIATGAILVSYKGIPPYPVTFGIQADKNICGTLEIADYENPTSAAFADEGAGKIITVTGVPAGDGEFLIPVPAGDYQIQVALMAADGATPAPRSNKGPATVNVVAGKISKMKPIDLEEGSAASKSYNKGTAADFDLSTLHGRWNVLGDNSSKNGIKVFGGGGENGYPAFVCPYDKTWDWDNTVYRESDNGLVVKVVGQEGYVVSGTMNWWNGSDGAFWNYIWKFQDSGKPQYVPFYGTDLSAYYNKIPKGEHAFSMDLSKMEATLSNGEKPIVLIPGTYTFGGNRALVIPDGCFALQFHLGNLKPMTSWNEKDIDRFMLCPLEYIIIFERTGDI